MEARRKMLSVPLALGFRFSQDPVDEADLLMEDETSDLLELRSIIRGDTGNLIDVADVLDPLGARGSQPKS